MNLAFSGLLIINFVFIVLFLLGKEIIFKIKNTPNLTAFYSVLLVVMFILYFFGIFVAVAASILAHKFLPVSLLLFVAFPFVIGQKVTYDKLGFYSNIQLLAFIGSFVLVASFLKLY